MGKGRDPLGSECPLGEAPEIPFTLGPGKPSEVPSLVLHLWGACLTSRALSYPQAEPSRAQVGPVGMRGREEEKKPGQPGRLLWCLRSQELCGIPLPIHSEEPFS